MRTELLSYAALCLTVQLWVQALCQRMGVCADGAHKYDPWFGHVGTPPSLSPFLTNCRTRQSCLKVKELVYDNAHCRISKRVESYGKGGTPQRTCFTLPTTHRAGLSCSLPQPSKDWHANSWRKRGHKTAVCTHHCTRTMRALQGIRLEHVRDTNPGSVPGLP